MTRPLRIEFPGALYHVTARGDRRKAIFIDDRDRLAWLEILEAVCSRFHLVVHAYCQMTNHFHLMVETVEGNLSQCMRQLNGTYTQFFNRRHGYVGHVLQGRYHALLVEKEAYLLTLARYIVLNPVRAGMVSAVDEWDWSSHRFTSAKSRAPGWLAVEPLLSRFGSARDEAIASYRQFIDEGVGAESPLKNVQHQLILGDDAFVRRHRGGMNAAEMPGIARAQRRLAALTLAEYRQQYPDRDEAIARAYWSTAFTMAEIGAFFAVGYSTVSRAVRRHVVDATNWTSN
jgi:putative transposase